MKIVIFTGAGISRESGIATFRDSDGLWANYRIEDVCTPAASLVHYLRPDTPIWIIDPNTPDTNLKNLHVISEPASVGVPQLVGELIGSVSN
jgi:NAD-dependent SIR2 family protein deacetylase